MVDYARDNLEIIYSTTSALDPAEIDRMWASVPTSPVKQMLVKFSASTSGTTVELSSFTTIEALYIRNVDATNYILASGRINKSSKTYATNKLGFVDGGSAADTITDADSAFLTSNYFQGGDYAVVTGATDAAANNKTFGPLSIAAAGTITVPTGQVTAEAAEAGLVTIVGVSPFMEKIIAGQWGKLNAVRPDDDLVVTANTAACVVEVYVVGT